MPCNDRDYAAERREELQETANANAALCAIASALEARSTLSDVLDIVDWKQAGVTRGAFENWWDDHKIRDAEMKRREATELRRAQLADRARAKLTPDELRALTKGN